jgi:RNA polymerase sigma factor (sigma-70 family)
MRTDDGSIIHRCLNGESEAFGILVDKYREGIYAFAYAKLRDFRDAQDVTQEVFVKAYTDLRTLRRRESFSFWLYRIAATRCKLWVRTQSRRIDRDFIEDQAPGILEDSSLESYRASQMGESVWEALDLLPDAYREVLIMHYFGGMSSKEIARAIGISPVATRVRLNRGRARLKEEMLAMMDTAFEGQKLPIGFTFHIVEAVKRLNPRLSITGDIDIPAGSLIPAEAKALKTGEIPVDILKTDEISVIASKQEDSDNESLDPQNALSMAPRAEEGSWARKEGMPTARACLSTSVVNGIIYAIGESTKWASMDHRTVEAYDPATDTWTKKADMPTARAYLSTSVVDGIIYAIGGWNDNELEVAPVEAYDPVTDAWTKKADMPTARGGFSTSVVDGLIYAIGGIFVIGSIGGGMKVEVYDPAMDTWTAKADMTKARWGLSTSVVNRMIYAIGGRIGGGINGVSARNVEVYDPVTDTWTEKADMPTMRGVHSASAVNGHIYVIGGWIDAATALVEECDPGSIAVEPREKLPTTWGKSKSR